MTSERKHEMNGVDLIHKERKRQITQEGWTSEHDDEHSDSELAMAAAVYAMPKENRDNMILQWNFAELLWPWNWEWFKPSKRNTRSGRIRELVKAGALIAAEIDRLQRIGK